MRYVINTAWKHDNPIDWEKMREYMKEDDKISDTGTSVQWFEIDENTNGSIAIFQSKEAFVSVRWIFEAKRKEAIEIGINMIYEVVGEIKAER